MACCCTRERMTPPIMADTGRKVSSIRWAVGCCDNLWLWPPLTGLDCFITVTVSHTPVLEMDIMRCSPCPALSESILLRSFFRLSIAIH